MLCTTIGQIHNKLDICTQYSSKDSHQLEENCLGSSTCEEDVCALIDHTMNMREQCIAAAEKGKSMFWGINKNREFWKFPFLEIVHLCLCQAQKSRMTIVILPSWVIYYFHTYRPNLEKLNHCTTCIYHILWELLGRNCLHPLSLT